VYSCWGIRTEARIGVEMKSFIPELWGPWYAKKMTAGSIFTDLMPKAVKRSLRERLFSSPWRPWKRWKWVPPAHAYDANIPEDRVVIRPHWMNKWLENQKKG